MSEIDPDADWTYDPELDELERLSNSVIDLLKRGRLGDAEQACRKLKEQFPDMIDWIQHTAAIHDARGEVGQAIEHYRLCIDFIDNDPEDFDPEIKEEYGQAIERLQSRHAR